MSMASENIASTAFVPELNDWTSMSAFGSSLRSGPLSASSTRPGAWVTLGKTPKRTVTLSSSGPGTPAPEVEEESGDEAPGALDAVVAAGVEAPDPLQAASRLLTAMIRAAVLPIECRVTEVP